MKSLRINITRDCNINCNYCYITNKNEYIDLNLFKDLLIKYKPNSVSISGGEPFLHTELTSFIRLALKQGSKVNVVTNGTLLSERFSLLAELKQLIRESNHLSISISIDGIFKCETESIRMLHDLGIKVQIYLYPSIDLIDKISDLKLLSEYIESFHLLFPVPMGRNMQTKITSSEWMDIVSKFEESCAFIGVPLFVQQGYSTLFNKYEKICFTDNQGIFIDSDTKSYGCCLMAEVSALGYILPSTACNTGGNGCAALNALYGSDYRLNEDLTPPCPLDVIKIL